MDYSKVCERGNDAIYVGSVSGLDCALYCAVEEHPHVVVREVCCLNIKYTV